MNISFEMSGFDKLEQQFDRLRRNAEAMDGEHAVSFAELFSPAFMEEHTQLESFEELFKRGGFTVSSPEDFEAIPEDEWDAVVAAHTEFEDWKAMQEAAAAAWFAKGLGLA